MSKLNSYLNFPGNTEEAFNFYKSVFGGEFLAVIRFKDNPAGDNIPAGEKDKIMHIALPVGNGSVLMATDALESAGHTITIGNNQHIIIEADSEEEGRRLFNGLSEGGKITMPFDKASWGAYFGMFIDKFGISWMVNYDYSRQGQS